MFYKNYNIWFFEYKGLCIIVEFQFGIDKRKKKIQLFSFDFPQISLGLPQRFRIKRYFA